MALTYDHLNSVVQDLVLPMAVDNFFNSNGMFWRLKNKGIKYRGSPNISIPVFYTSATGADAYDPKVDDISTTDTDTLTKAVFAWKYYSIPIVVSADDELESSGPNAVLDFVETKSKAAEWKLNDLLGTHLMGTAATYTKRINGLGDCLSASSTYGGIAVADMATWIAAINSSTTACTLAAMQTQFGSQTIDSKAPTCIITNQALFDKVWGLMEAKRQIQGTENEMANAGFRNLLFNGVPLFVDSHIPGTGGVSATNDNDMYFLNEEYLWLYVHQDRNFILEPFQKPINQDRKVAHIKVALNLACSSRRMQGGFQSLDPTE
jgi:hypothetical protein